MMNAHDQAKFLPYGAERDDFETFCYNNDIPYVPWEQEDEYPIHMRKMTEYMYQCWLIGWECGFDSGAEFEKARK